MKNEYIFKRIEKKYLMSPEMAARFRKAIEPYTDQETYAGGSDVSSRISYYFETKHLKTYMDHKNRRRKRFKIRLRFYNRGEFLPDSGFVEMKIKNDKQTSKTRFQVNRNVMVDYLNGGNWQSQLIDLNSDFDRESMIDVSGQIIDVIETLKMQPILSVMYKRVCRYNKASGVRITFDTDLCYTATNNTLIQPVMNQVQGPGDKVIMEIKASKQIPEWLRLKIEEFGLKKQRFSKYCQGVESLYLDSVIPKGRNINTSRINNDIVINEGSLNEFFELFAVSRS